MNAIEVSLIIFISFISFIFGFTMGHEIIPGEIESKQIIIPDTVITITNGLPDTVYIYKQH